MIDIGGMPGYNFTSATAINSSGQVAGYSEDSSGQGRAFLYSNGQMTNLGTLPGDTSSSAFGINSQGIVVGTSWHIGSSLNNALNNNAFADQNGVMTNLNSLIPSSLNIHLQDAVAINDAGQILAYGVDSSGAGLAYLLTPSDMPAPVPPVFFGTEVPEPSTFAFGLMLGAVACAKWGYRRLVR